ncbi:MAG: hypothetical protein KDA69_16260, partial [Planctomycetaceae bacterium]|nr:hypothetical protein [Planctomycetaceae bacterium]
IIEDFEKEPTAFCYAFAQNYQAIQYYRLDPPGSTPDDIMNRLWANLAGGLPAMFGFTVYSSIYDHDVQNTGCIPFPAATEGIEGGHAVCAVGYDDDKVITNPNNNESTTGAFLIRNSWGTGWGESGYGWLPYEYVYKGLADDWWSLLDNEWIDTGEFSV